MNHLMTKAEINQVVIESADRIYNNPQNLSKSMAELNSATETLTATLLHNVENLIVDVLYNIQEMSNEDTDYAIINTKPWK